MNNLELFKRTFASPFKDEFFGTDMDKFMNEWMGPRYASLSKETLAWNPRVDISETKTHYLMKFDLPGVPKDQIKIDLHDGRLTVSGERKTEKTEEDKEKKTHFSEVSYGSFMRSFTFPTAVDAEKTDARYDAGVLTLQIAKANPASARQIFVK